MGDNKNYVVVVKNYIEDYLDLFNFQSSSFSIYVTDLKDLSNVVSSLNKEIIKEKLIFMVDKDFLNSEVLDTIIKIFSGNLKFYSPYFLYLTKFIVSKSEEYLIARGENFFYLLPDKTEIETVKYNFWNFINVIFQKLVVQERLNYYIVDSFQTIIDSELISKQKIEIEKLNKEITELSKVDFLTNLLNRRAFFEALDSEKKRSQRDVWRISSSSCSKPEKDDNFENLPEGDCTEHFGRFACVLIDIDFFKRINDSYGHLIGDSVIKKIGEVLNAKTIFRENDIIARYGGEEFIIILPETNAQNAKTPTNRLREYIKTIDFYDDKKNVFHISISIGISEFRMNDESNEELIQRADQALYVTKEQGR
nr:GGDEF domain-containing protein [Spirochaetota bacterium]